MNLKFDWDLVEMGMPASCGISCVDGLHGAVEDSLPRFTSLAWLGSWCWLPGRAQLVLLVRGLGSPPLGHLHVATWAFSQGDAWIQETWVEVTSVIFY